MTAWIIGGPIPAHLIQPSTPVKRRKLSGAKLLPVCLVSVGENCGSLLAVADEIGDSAAQVWDAVFEFAKADVAVFADETTETLATGADRASLVIVTAPMVMVNAKLVFDFKADRAAVLLEERPQFDLAKRDTVVAHHLGVSRFTPVPLTVVGTRLTEPLHEAGLTAGVVLVAGSSIELGYRFDGFALLAGFGLNIFPHTFRFEHLTGGCSFFGT